MKKFIYKENEYKLLLLTNSGSRLYGTNYNKGEYSVNKEYESDYDYKGIIIASDKDKFKITNKPLQEISYSGDKSENEKEEEFQKRLKERNELLTLLNKTYNLNLKDNSDITLFETEKLLNLILNNNPNSMDIIYASNKNILYKDDLYEIINKEKNNFLTKKVFKSFYEYGKSQIYKMASGKRYNNEFPKTKNVMELLVYLAEEKIIDHKWVKEYFHIDLANKIIKNKTLIKEPINWEDFEKFFDKTELFKKFDITKEELNKYKKPNIKDNIYIKNTNNDKIKITKKINDYFNINKDITIYEYLKKYAVLRKVNETNFFIYEQPDENEWGVFTIYDGIKKNDHSKIGKFLFILTLDINNLKKHYSKIEKLWKWRTKRNKKRSILEEKFGFDLKNAAHLYRLMLKSMEIAKTNKYQPELNSNNIKLIKDILEGKKTYEEIIKDSEKLQKKLSQLEITLIEDVDEKILNNISIKINKLNNNKEKFNLISQNY